MDNRASVLWDTWEEAREGRSPTRRQKDEGERGTNEPRTPAKETRRSSIYVLPDPGSPLWDLNTAHGGEEGQN